MRETKLAVKTKRLSLIAYCQARRDEDRLSTIRNLMRTIIRNKQTGQYVIEGGWTPDRKLARDFNRIEDAVRYRSAQPIEADLQIIYQSGDEPSNYDVTW